MLEDICCEAYVRNPAGALPPRADSSSWSIQPVKLLGTFYFAFAIIIAWLCTATVRCLVGKEDVIYRCSRPACPPACHLLARFQSVSCMMIPEIVPYLSFRGSSGYEC